MTARTRNRGSQSARTAPHEPSEGELVAGRGPGRELHTADDEPAPIFAAEDPRSGKLRLHDTGTFDHTGTAVVDPEAEAKHVREAERASK